MIPGTLHSSHRNQNPHLHFPWLFIFNSNFLNSKINEKWYTIYQMSREVKEWVWKGISWCRPHMLTVLLSSGSTWSIQVWFWKTNPYLAFFIGFKDVAREGGLHICPGQVGETLGVLVGPGEPGQALQLVFKERRGGPGLSRPWARALPVTLPGHGNRLQSLSQHLQNHCTLILTPPNLSHNPW